MTEMTTSDLVLEQLQQGLALPGDLYTSPTLFAEEMSVIFGRQWLYAGHVSEIPDAGDYLTVASGDESCIVVRDADGTIHGLLNVCRHRGARLVECGTGSSRRFTCPYHQWSYSHDGSLAGAPRMPDSFDKSQWPLKKVHTSVWQGLIFVNFSPDDEVELLPELMKDATELMAPFQVEHARIAHTEVYEVDANWKLVWENAQECYHCNANHPEFIRTFDVREMSQPTAGEAPLWYSEDRRSQSARFPLKPGAVSLTMSGEPASAKPMGEFAQGLEPYTAAAHLKPGFAFVFSADYGITFVDTPVSPDRTHVKVQWLVHRDAVEGVDYEVDNLIRVWDQTNRQDWELCRSVQEGVKSQAFEPGPLSLDETSVAGFYYAYARMMSAAGL